jgi:hypothetical protein
MVRQILSEDRGRLYEFVEFRELNEEDRKFLMRFVRLCRRSKGFWQW